MKIDAHQHFWKFDPVRDSWITPEMNIIKKDFLPNDLLKELLAANMDGCVAVQADQSEHENEFLLTLADEYDCIKAVVGWVDFCAADVGERLAYYAAFKKMKGFRYILQGEPDREFMLRPDFMNGIAMLQQFNFTYDILIHADQLQYLPQFVNAFPDQKFVIDHLAKPNIKKGELKQWKKGLETIAQFENVYCKISGMITEAGWNNWTIEDLKPYLYAVWECFGAKRLIFGSDYPVCLLATTYQRWVDVMKEYTSLFSANEQHDFWGNNAVRFYGL